MRIESKHLRNMMVDTKPYVFSIGVRFETRKMTAEHTFSHIWHYQLYCVGVLTPCWGWKIVPQCVLYEDVKTKHLQGLTPTLLTVHVDAMRHCHC